MVILRALPWDEKTMQLFLVYLGGIAPGANIELHDVRFVAAERIEDTYTQLCQQWFGSVKGLHIDSYMQVKHIDGYSVSVQREPQNLKRIAQIRSESQNRLGHLLSSIVTETSRKACEIGA